MGYARAATFHGKSGDPWAEQGLISDIQLLDRNFPGGRPTKTGRHQKWDKLFIRVKPARKRRNWLTSPNIVHKRTFTESSDSAGINRHGYARLREAVQSALDSGAHDVSAVRYLLTASCSRMDMPALDIGLLDRYERPLPLMNDYDRLLSMGAAQ